MIEIEAELNFSLLENSSGSPWPGGYGEFIFMLWGVLWKDGPYGAYGGSMETYNDKEINPDRQKSAEAMVVVLTKR